MCLSLPFVDLTFVGQCFISVWKVVIKWWCFERVEFAFCFLFILQSDNMSNQFKGVQTRVFCAYWQRAQTAA